MRAYVSCNCFQCKHVSTSKKKFHKNKAHRELRRKTKEYIQRRLYDTIPNSVSTGYKA